jgi:hypothetical protein
MELNFIPGELKLEKQRDGDYVVTIKGEEVFRGKVEKKALAEYNRIRKQMEQEFPPHELTPEQKRKALERMIADIKYTQVRNESKKPIKDKIAKTRTFG